MARTSINQTFFNIGSEFAGADQFIRKLLQKLDFVRKTPNSVLMDSADFVGVFKLFGG